MITTQNRRGSTLVLSMGAILIMFGLAMSLLFQAQSQSSETGALRLAQMYEMASFSAIQKEKASLSDDWDDIDHFTPLLTSLTTESEHGYGKLYASGTFTSYSGASSMRYNVYVANNSGDYGIVFSEHGSANYNVDQDYDGYIVMTAEVFIEGQEVPVAVNSAIIAPTGEESVEFAELSVTEQNMNRQGTGTIDQFDRALDLNKFSDTP
ncbi:hypothetical protein [Acanthopleuribacter pedis]|uniref:Uncharacterized protein n=1 Tax=Acanthopleuribacter pedis TaxID=442870 RepID=A0A8J7U4P3_9BACT|nr:hypothetical protein [Acanthopleuribacter pedis]MBO1320852.1 hypothetical protein [Acanthopleuribacter pedis]